MYETRLNAVDRWLQGQPMTSSLEVTSESRASKPTVIAALEHLRKLDVIAGPNGDFAVQPPGWDAWQSLALDLKILWRTVVAVLRREGISAEGHETMPKFEGSPRRYE